MSILVLLLGLVLQFYILACTYILFGATLQPYKATLSLSNAKLSLFFSLPLPIFVTYFVALLPLGSLGEFIVAANMQQSPPLYWQSSYQTMTQDCQ